MTVRDLAKRGVESALVRARVPELALRFRDRNRPFILAYHNVHRDEDAPGADASLHLPLSRFIEQIELVARYYDIVSLEEALFGSRRSSGAVAAITFDDAYVGAMSLAIPALVQRGIPATVFVAPAYVGGRAFWWDEYLGAGADGDLRERALTVCHGSGEEVRALVGRASNVIPDHARCVTEAQLHEAARQPGITLGSHTWSHRNLTTLGESDLESELEQPLAWLRERFANVSPTIAYPYGLFDSRSEAMARQLGYRAGLRLGSPWEKWSLEEPYRIPRLNIPAGASLEGVQLRITGVVR